MNEYLGDDVAEDLAKLDFVEELDLRSTEITDAAIPHLSSLKNLRLLMVSQTYLTQDGIRRLKTALPNCHVDATTGF